MRLPRLYFDFQISPTNSREGSMISCIFYHLIRLVGHLLFGNVMMRVNSLRYYWFLHRSLRTTTKWKKKALAKHVEVRVHRNETGTTTHSPLQGKRATETLILRVSACNQPSLAWLPFPFQSLGFFFLEITFAICSKVPGTHSLNSAWEPLFTVLEVSFSCSTKWGIWRL